MAGITGARGTANIAAEQREIDMADTIALLEPESSPLTLLSKKASKERTVDPKFSWEEDSSEPRFDAINAGAGYASGITAIVVDNGAEYAEHYLVQVTRTGEIMRVQAVAGNTLTVVRGVGSTAAAAIIDDDELLLIGIAQPEGDTSRPARSTNPVNVYNFTQIVREPWELTGTARSSNNKTSPHDWDHQAKKHGIEHAKDIEYVCLVGQRSEDTSGSQPRRTSRGIIPTITTNVTDAGGALSETEFQTFLRTLFRYGGKRKQGFASALIVGALNNFAQGKLETHSGESSYGLSVSSYVSPFGTYQVMTHWLLEGAKYGGYAVGIDFASVKYRYLGGGVGGSRDTHIRTNIQANDADARKDEYLSECGLQTGAERRHALLTGVTS